MIHRLTIRPLVWLIGLALVLPMQGPAAEPADEKERAAEFFALAKREAESYSFRGDRSNREFVLRSEPVLKWTNPVVGTIYGNDYIWTVAGRPEVVVSIYKWYSPYEHLSHALQSLSLEPFHAEREGRVVWTPERPGIALAPVPDAPAPAGTPAQRLRQMRDLAQKFTARQTDRSNVDRDMRLLTQPIYRYEKTEGDLIDGAMFAFVLGTDPEAYLLLEDRLVDGQPRWQFALARMSNIHLYVSYDGREVWSVPTLPYAALGNRREPFTSFRFNPVEAAEKP